MLVFYWLVDFRPVWHQFLGLVLWILIMTAISGLLGRSNLFNRVLKIGPDERPRLRHAFGLLLILVVAGLTFVLSWSIAPTVDAFMNKMYADSTRAADTSQPPPGR